MGTLRWRQWIGEYGGVDGDPGSSDGSVSRRAGEEGVRGIDPAEGDYDYFLFLTLVTYLYFVHHEEEQVERKLCARGSVSRGAIGSMTACTRVSLLPALHQYALLCHYCLI